MIKFDWTIALGSMVHLAVLCVLLLILWRSITRRLDRIEDKEDRIINQRK